MSTDEEDMFIVGFDFVENKKIQNIRSFILYLLTPPGGAITLIKGQRSTDSLSSCRLDLLPFYSRLVATLHPCMSDVAEDLCSMLKGDFRFHVGPLLLHLLNIPILGFVVSA